MAPFPLSRKEVPSKAMGKTLQKAPSQKKVTASTHASRRITAETTRVPGLKENRTCGLLQKSNAGTFTKITEKSGNQKNTKQLRKSSNNCWISSINWRHRHVLSRGWLSTRRFGWKLLCCTRPFLRSGFYYPPGWTVHHYGGDVQWMVQ